MGPAIGVEVEEPSVITSSVETTAPILPADDEPRTLPASGTDLADVRASFPSVAEITTAHGLSSGPPRSVRAPLPAAGRAAIESSPGFESETGARDDLSLITPRFDSGALASDDLAFADTGALANEEPEADVDTVTNAPLLIDASSQTPDIGEDPTLQREPDEAPADGEAPTLSLLSDDPPTLDPIVQGSAHRPLAASEEDQTAPRVSPQEILKAPVNVSFAPMRPRMDSEAAGHWPSWQSQTAGAAVAMQNVMTSPVSSDTAALPRSTVQQALGLVRSETARNLEAATDELIERAPSPPGEIVATPRPATMPLDRTELAPFGAANRAVSAPPPPFAGNRSGSASDATPAPRSAAPRAPSSVSPVAVFIITFFLVGGILTALVTAQSLGWFASFRRTNASPSSPEDAPSRAVSSRAPGIPSPAAAASATAAPPSAPSSSAPPLVSSDVSAAASSSASPSSKGPKGKRRRTH